MSLVSTPRTWVAAEVVTAAEMNAEIRDAFNGVQAAYGSYAPSWTAATTNPTLNNGTITGNYLQIGKRIEGRIILTIGSTTTLGSGAYTFGLPATAVDANGIQASGWLSGPNKTLVGRGASTTGVFVYATDTISAVGSATALTTGQRVQISFSYEAA
jgi:hypothetical protein